MSRRFFLRIALAIAFTALCTTAAARDPIVAAKEKEWRSCEGGYYTGPREGRRNYTIDRYLWVVTPAFAKRFCMPEHMVSEELKGAEAIAFRMVDGADSDRCSVDDEGKAHCTHQSVARFEIYMPRSLDLPASHPEVRFFEDSRSSSSWLLSGLKDNGTRANRYRSGAYVPPPGRISRYRNPFGYPSMGFGFGLVYGNDTHILWPTSTLFESRFEQEWEKGLDLLILEWELGTNFLFEKDSFAARNLSPDSGAGQYMITFRNLDDPLQQDEKRLSALLHFIRLPREYGKQVRQLAVSNAPANWSDFLQLVRRR